MPKYSVLIPTRQRHDTLKYAMETVLAQTFGDFELVVMDNCSDERTAEVVASFGSDKVVYLRSDEVLPMTANWERGLEACSGEYVTVIGDDDGLFSNALAVCDLVIGQTDSTLVSWRPDSYWWPNAIAPWQRNRLYVRIIGQRPQISDVESESILKAYYDCNVGFSALPGIYSAVVHRSVIEAVQRSVDQYFLTMAPDAFSGVVNLWFTEQFHVINFPLSVRGISGHSNGTSQLLRSLGRNAREMFEAENGNFEALVHPLLVPSPNLQITEATVKLLAKEMLFPDNDRLDVDIATVCRCMAQGMNVDPGSYDDTLGEIRALAAKHDIDLSSIDIPAKAAAPLPAAQGPRIDSNGNIEVLGIDGNRAGLATIADAVRLAEAMQPSLLP